MQLSALGRDADINVAQRISICAGCAQKKVQIGDASITTKQKNECLKNRTSMTSIAFKMYLDVPGS